MKTTFPPLIKAHEADVDEYEVEFTKDTFTYLIKELIIWQKIEDLVEIDTLTSRSLEVIREVFNKLKLLFESSVP